ncbi:hypothetical protein [Candidatus Thiosymbion oneisti]|uniref:hypothetical protein n=1 Tax=Candidatus Thiosymbion oneisti TaxID=589554 RepID=UPI000B7EA0AE|nr:hypothetical protein [Candidatus Thiosymbion oneisti]
MFNTILEAIKRLENEEKPSKSSKELLDYLHSEADKEVNSNLINLMTYGQRLGWERIENRVAKLLDFIQAAKGNSDSRG